MEITGTFPKVTRNTPSIVYQAPLGRAIDAGIDGHGTVIPGNLPEWSKNPTIAAKLAEFGITGEIDNNRRREDGWTDGGEAFEHMRGHVGPSGKSMVREFWALAKALKLVRTWDDEDDFPMPAEPTAYPGAPPLSGPGSVYERLAIYGLITSATPYDGPMPSQKRLAEIYYQNKLIPGVNEEAWMRDERGLRPLPERWAAPDNGVGLFRALERAVGAWGLAKAEGAANAESKRIAAHAAYEDFLMAWIPAEFAGAAPAFGDREYNPRSLFYAADRIENAIAQDKPTAAAVSGPRTAFALGLPQVFSLYEGESMRSTAAEMTAGEWKLYLGQKPSGGSGPGLGVGGQASG